MEDMFEVEVRGKNNVYYKVRICCVWTV